MSKVNNIVVNVNKDVLLLTINILNTRRQLLCVVYLHIFEATLHTHLFPLFFNIYLCNNVYIL